MHGARTFADTTLDVLNGRHLAFHVLHHQIVVHLDSRFDQLLVIGLNIINHIGRYVGNLVVFWQTCVIPDVSLLGQDVDHAHEVIFTTDRQSHNQRISSQYVADLVHYTIEISSETIELVNKDQSRDFRFVRIAPVGF